MKAIRVLDGRPTLVDAPEPAGDGTVVDPVLVDIAAASICGSDLHLIESGIAEGRVLGHEFAGTAPDGTPVAVEPLGWCGACLQCEAGHWNHCSGDFTAYGVFADGGMAERLMVPATSLVPLPPGLDPSIASVAEPLAVAVHGARRVRLSSADRVAVVGAGPIGLALVAVCRAGGVGVDVEARHDHQRAAVERLGGSVGTDGAYDVVFDAVGSESSLAASVALAGPLGRIGLVGSLWEPARVDMGLCMKEVEIVPSMMYARSAAGRDFERAVGVLAAAPVIADVMITHRFPLDAVDEAFATAADRAAGAIKVVFEPGSR